MIPATSLLLRQYLDFCVLSAAYWLNQQGLTKTPQAQPRRDTHHSAAILLVLAKLTETYTETGEQHRAMP